MPLTPRIPPRTTLANVVASNAPGRQVHRLGGGQLTGVPQCPHCGVSAPVLLRVWASDNPLPRGDGQPASRWSAYSCTTCGHVVTAKGNPLENAANPIIVAQYPPIWAPHESLPESVTRFLCQARNTLTNPDASVVMSAAAVDAMLKDYGLVEGSLYARIDQAVTNGILTGRMAEWAHRVRLDANSSRHADGTVPPMSRDDADRAFDFAEALGEYLYVLPSRMPPQPQHQA